ncbi:hypothetical protein SteCoe_24994 [Stentor coeruleus]|uniref:Uncharacterized protein n=1 Tax=Stentor coeruleus TaxID=5963 RepID=A0A1R2BG96_9CILI|nr:hypothetical protein SteCoe_24994 [Stentor coeruleus]
MKFSDTKDDFEKDNSWISISSIKKAANISAVIETFQSESTLPVNLSTTSGWDTVDKSLESINLTSLNYSSLPRSKQKMPSYTSLLKKILILNEEISILSLQLRSSNKEIERLSHLLEEQEKNHTIKIQFMQEQHEKRLQKSKTDLDFLLKDLNMKSTALLAEEFLKKHSEDLENLKDYYEKKLEDIKKAHENEIIYKEIEQDKSLNALKQKFFRYLSEVEKRFKKELNELRSEYNRDWIEMQRETFCVEGKDYDQASNDEGSTYYDFDCEFYKKSLCSRKGCKNTLKISVCETGERLSCESCLSTRRDSR